MRGRLAIARVRRVTGPWRLPSLGLCRRANLVCLVGGALFALGSGPAQAAADPLSPRGVIAGTSVCPEPAAVWSALAALAVVDRVETRLRALAGEAPPVEVTDLGVAFRVRAGDRTREYQDNVRDCASRAKLAAVFVALAADSADDPMAVKLAQTPPGPPPPVTLTTGQPTAAPNLRRHTLHLELGADARLAVGASSVAPGALAQLAWDRGRLSMAAGARGSAPAHATIGGVRLRQWRVAAQLAARWGLLRERRVSPFLELGAVAALLGEKGTDLATARTGMRGELGIVAGGGISFLRRGWGSPFALVEAEVDPVPPTISALPAGDVGRTPRVWFGAALGFSVGLL